MAEVEPALRHSVSVDSSVLSSEEAICLFAFADSVDALQRHLSDVTLEQRVMLHRVGSVAALVGVVPIADYCGADSEPHVSDIARLASRVRGHAELVAWTMQWSSVFPAPFGTLYSSLDSLTAFMQAHEATIAAFLHSVANKEEWELRAVAQFNDPDALDQLACNAWPEWRNLSKGARYMRLCRDKSALLDIGRTEAAAFLRDIVAELLPFTKDVRLLDLPRSSDSAGPQPVARYALLVTKSDVVTIKERVREIAPSASHQYIAIALSGPLPPFSFRPDLKQPN